jgi:hypothetical protein
MEEPGMTNSTSIRDGLLDAAYALDEQAAGRQPDRARLLAGAVTLDTLFRRGVLDRDLQDAALGLERLVTAGAWELDRTGRLRAAELATRVRMLAMSKADGNATHDDA